MWENTVITNAGIELLKNALSGGTITVTAIKSGAGKVDVSALKSQTAVSSIKQSGTVQGVTKTNETIKIGVLFSNAGLSAGYSMTQLGIYAKGSTGSEVLFAISQSTTGKEVPAESAMPSWSLVHNFYIKLNNDVKMTATVDPEGYVTFETMQTALNTHTGNKSNPHSVTKSQVGLGSVPNVATNDQTPTYSDTTTLVTLSSGEKISIAFAKIKLAITTLINHLANKSNPHGVTKSQVGLGNVENKSSATIRGELTKGNVTTALGFTPANQTDMTNAQDAITQLNSEIAGSKQCGASYQGSYFYPETFSSSGNKIGKIFVFWARIKNSLAMPANWYNLCNFVDKPVTEITGWCPCNIFVDGTDPRDVSCVYHNEYGLRIVVPNGCTIPKDSWININGCLLLK
jgi:hypothetical protein